MLAPIAQTLCPSSFSWIDLFKQQDNPVEFIVEGLVPKDGVTLFTGEGGIGKSFMVMELAYAVASGEPFLGRFKTIQGSVLYIDLENSEGVIALRVKKITRAHHPDAGEDAPTLPVNFLKKQGQSAAGFYINEDSGAQLFNFLIKSYKPMLIIVDPLTAFHTSDENDNVSMRKLIGWLQRIARGLKGAVVMVHHPRKRGMINDPGQMIRGASDLRNAVDSHLFVRRLTKTRVLVEQDKSRYASEIDPFKVDIKDNDDGTAIHITLVEEPVKGTSKAAVARDGIIALLTEKTSVQLADILDELRKSGISETTARRTMREMIEKGVMQKGRWGVYSLPECQTDPESE